MKILSKNPRIPLEALRRVGRTSMGFLALISLPALAHSPICNCYDNGDDTVTCEGGFSDGASAEGVSIRIVDDRDRVIIDAAMDKHSTFSFDWPNEDFHVIFDAGDSHIVTIYVDDIE